MQTGLDFTGLSTLRFYMTSALKSSFPWAWMKMACKDRIQITCRDYLLIQDSTVTRSPGEEKKSETTPLTFQLARMEFTQELPNAIWGNCKGDSCSHLQRVYANHITILPKEGTLLSCPAVQTEQAKEGEKLREALGGAAGGISGDQQGGGL